MEFNYVLKRKHVVGWKGISISGQYRLEDSSLSLDLSSFSVSDISLSNELEDSKILGIKFDSIK
jgi:hypothetical protein